MTWKNTHTHTYIHTHIYIQIYSAGRLICIQSSHLMHARWSAVSPRALRAILVSIAWDLPLWGCGCASVARSRSLFARFLLVSSSASGLISFFEPTVVGTDRAACNSMARCLLLLPFASELYENGYEGERKWSTFKCNKKVIRRFHERRSWIQV